MSALDALAAFEVKVTMYNAPSLTTFVINILNIDKALSNFFWAVLLNFVRRLSSLTRSFYELLCFRPVALPDHL